MLNNPADLRKRRLARLEQELSDENVVLPSESPLPGGFSSPETLRQVLMEELLYARYAPVHEERRHSYCSVVVSSESWASRLPLEGKALLPTLEDVGSKDFSSSRLLADGQSSALIRSVDSPLGLLALEDGGEFTLVKMARELESCIVQRLSTGQVKLFTGDRVYLWENETWSFRRYASTEASKLLLVLGLDGSADQTASALLDSCLHRLGAQHIGTILVWVLQDEPPDSSSGGWRPPVDLQVVNDVDQRVLTTLLQRLDGACLVDRAGRVMKVGVHLNPSARAQELVQAEEGTRHTSAKRFSFDEPRTVAFTVSQDGPVTVYSDGMSVLDLRSVGTYGSSLAQMVPDKAEDITTFTIDRVCSRCGKRFRVEVTSIVGWNEREETGCPVCGHPSLASARSAFSVEALHPVKPWDEDGSYP
jgi:DNA integrity scanning protein DisA with diadenylate cyclase activity